MSPGRIRFCHLLEVARHHLPVVVEVGSVEPAHTHGKPVEQIVQPLGHGEEALVAHEDEPARLDAGASTVGHQRLEHLGHAAHHARLN